MKLAYLLSIVTVINAAYVPSEPWSTLTPSATIKDATTSLPGSYALSLKTISAASASAAPAKRDVVNQIGDGQVQQQTAETTSVASLVNQIGDGQVQQQTADLVNQIGDGQVQQQTADLVNQIGDGQVQQQTADLVNQIGDGQVQQQTATVVNQIGDGQVQQQTASVANQISDGQVQATATADAASQISDGQVQATGSPSTDNGIVKTCVKDDSLLLELKDGVLTDMQGRIGSIVANRQFQFDGPPPQAGAIYAAGWAVVPIDFSDSKSDDSKAKREAGVKLALGTQTTFYKCLSGEFYNLYDQSIGAQCSEVEFVLLEATTC